AEDGGGTGQARRVRRRILLSGGGRRQGAHSDADVVGTHRRGHHLRHRCVHRRRPRHRHHLRTAMKALAKSKAEPGIWMIDAPVPEIGPTDVLVKIHKTGICGTDVHIYKWDDWASKTVPVPM